MRSRTDHALLHAAARGDEAAFAALVARHRPRLVRYATSRCGRDGALAEDAVQDALVRAHRAIPARGRRSRTTPRCPRSRRRCSPACRGCASASCSAA